MLIKSEYNIESYCLCAYYPTSHVWDRKDDGISTEILKFKDNIEPITSKFINIAIEEISKNKTLSNVDYIIRALGSSELKSDPNTPLHKLCDQLSKRISKPYFHSAITKKEATPELKYIKGRREKLKVLKDNYEFTPPDTNGEKPKILLVDDITTSRTTQRVIYEAINEKLKDNFKLYFFTLADTKLEDARISKLINNNLKEVLDGNKPNNEIASLPILHSKLLEFYNHRIYEYIDKLIIKFWGCKKRWNYSQTRQYDNTYTARTEVLNIVKELVVSNKTLCLIHPDLIKNLILALNPEPDKIKKRPPIVEIILGEKIKTSNTTIIPENELKTLKSTNDHMILILQILLDFDSINKEYLDMLKQYLDNKLVLDEHKEIISNILEKNN